MSSTTQSSGGEPTAGAAVSEASTRCASREARSRAARVAMRIPWAAMSASKSVEKLMVVAPSVYRLQMKSYSFWG